MNIFDNQFPRIKKKETDNSHWLSVSDLMAGLMVIFLFIAVSFMISVNHEKTKISEVVVIYKETQIALYNELYNEFKDDLLDWNASIEKDTLTINFWHPEILFDKESTQVKEKFKEVLDSFFPRFLKIVYKFDNNIEEVRIEGHTNSVWNGAIRHADAYFNNMELSQNRARAVLKYVYENEIKNPIFQLSTMWVEDKTIAIGYSSSKKIALKNGKEDLERSRRVTFRVITNAETQLKKILEVL